MERYFNTEGLCEPKKHYMVRLDERLALIRKRYVERGSYFVINCGRQYGKTTTLRALALYLNEDYVVLSLDFQGIGTEEFRDEAAFVKAFAKLVLWTTCRQLSYADLFRPLEGLADEKNRKNLSDLFFVLSNICGASEKPVILMIDEVDSASNNQVFLDFLALLRKYYLDRENTPTFHSVILAGVYDIKNLKLKIRPEAEHKYNSPWNIAAKFNISMGFSVKQIAAMLWEYEEDHHTGMEADAIAEEIYAYTSGYPYLVSAICKLLDEEIPYRDELESVNVWTREGIEGAVKILLREPAPIFESMVRQLYEHSEMRQMLYSILFLGKRVSYRLDNPAINLAAMFGYIRNWNESVQVANRIFETRLYNLFLSEEECTDALYDRAQGNIHQFIRNGRLDMDTVMRKFVEYYTDICGSDDEKFLEANGRKLFLLYLKPIINGTGNYYIEAQTRDARRTDVIVDYRGEQFIIELKIWHGNEYNERGEAQLMDYLNYYHKDKGYMVSFNFNKKKEIGVKQVQIGEKTIIEATV